MVLKSSCQYSGGHLDVDAFNDSTSVTEGCFLASSGKVYCPETFLSLTREVLSIRMSTSTSHMVTAGALLASTGGVYHSGLILSTSVASMGLASGMCSISQHRRLKTLPPLIIQVAISVSIDTDWRGLLHFNINQSGQQLVHRCRGPLHATGLTYDCSGLSSQQDPTQDSKQNSSDESWIV